MRFPWPGARFHPLGAPGAKRLVRFLADRGLPRELRAQVPLVCRGEEILWVAGYEPSELHRLSPGSTERLRLVLHAAPRAPAAGARAAVTSPPRTGRLGGPSGSAGAEKGARSWRRSSKRTSRPCEGESRRPAPPAVAIPPGSGSSPSPRR
ncbi:MAG: tRNA lysidine(34) synthetase TilS [Planctomycetota bacterium]